MREIIESSRVSFVHNMYTVSYTIKSLVKILPINLKLFINVYPLQETQNAQRNTLCNVLCNDSLLYGALQQVHSYVRVPADITKDSITRMLG